MKFRFGRSGPDVGFRYGARYGFQGSQAFVAGLADPNSFGIPVKRVAFSTAVDLEKSNEVTWEVLAWMDDIGIVDDSMDFLGPFVALSH